MSGLTIRKDIPMKEYRTKNKIILALDEMEVGDFVLIPYEPGSLSTTQDNRSRAGVFRYEAKTKKKFATSANVQVDGVTGLGVWRKR